MEDDLFMLADAHEIILEILKDNEFPLKEYIKYKNAKKDTAV